MQRAAAPYLAFAGFGMFWGTWGAALPTLRDAAGLTDAELGVALLCVGLGALPAMLFTGRAVDRFGDRTVGVLLIALAIPGVLLAQYAQNIASVAIGMLLVGATSGAADVAANALAGAEEARSRRRVITLAHAVFSSSVVMGSLGSGAVFAANGDVELVFMIAGLVIVLAGTAVLALGSRPRRPAPRLPMPRLAAPRPTAASCAPISGRRMWALSPFIAVGLVGALGFAAENAHQSWGAIFLADELEASSAVAATAPATFAAFAAVTRFAVGFLTRIPAGGLLFGGALVAVSGTLLIAVSQNIAVALSGLALAAVGTSVLFPTLLSVATRDVHDEYRGRVTSAIATTAYLGYLLGPVYVGLLAGVVGLPGSMVGVAAIAAAFAALAPLVIRRTRELRNPRKLNAPKNADTFQHCVDR